MFELTGKVALVTGSSTGIGKGVALGFAQSGADVIINYRKSAEDAREVQKMVEQLGRRALLVQADVGNPHDVAEMFAQIEQAYGRLDILVNNAARSHVCNIFETELSDWERILGTNLTSNFLCCKYALEMMKRQGWGRILQMTSIAGQTGSDRGQIHYSSAKAGQIGFTKTLALTVAQYGITVNAISPGVIMTEVSERDYGWDAMREMTRDIPLGLGDVQDVAAAAVFLASEEAKYITGFTLDVNGGAYLH